MSPEHARVVIVDDNEQYVRDLQDFLEKIGHQMVEWYASVNAVQLALNGGEFERLVPQVLIIDDPLRPFSRLGVDGTEVVDRVAQYAHVHHLVLPYMIGNPFNGGIIRGVDVTNTSRNNLGKLAELVGVAPDPYIRSKMLGNGFSR